MSSIRASRFVPLILVAALLASACTEASAPTEPAVHERSGSVAFGREGHEPAWAGDLEGRLNAERARIKLRREGNRAALDSLKKEYDVFRHSIPKGKGKDKASDLLFCEPQPYDAETKVIGPEGGELAFGPHKIRIKPGALTEPTLITAEAPSALLVSAEFSPHGLVFDNAVQLELSYKHCSLPTNFGKLRAVFLDDQDNIVEYPAAFDYKKGDKVVSWIYHFSKYAVAY